MYYFSILSGVEGNDVNPTITLSICYFATINFIFIESIYFKIKNIALKMGIGKNLLKVLLIFLAIIFSAIIVTIVHSYSNDFVKWGHIIFTTIAAICNAINLLHIDKHID